MQTLVRLHRLARSYVSPSQPPCARRKSARHVGPIWKLARGCFSSVTGKIPETRAVIISGYRYSRQPDTMRGPLSRSSAPNEATTMIEFFHSIIGRSAAHFVEGAQKQGRPPSRSCRAGEGGPHRSPAPSGQVALCPAVPRPRRRVPVCPRCVPSPAWRLPQTHSRGLRGDSQRGLGQELLVPLTLLSRFRASDPEAVELVAKRRNSPMFAHHLKIGRHFAVVIERAAWASLRLFPYGHPHPIFPDNY